MFEDGYEDSMEENSINGLVGIFGDFICWSVVVFSDGDGVRVVDGGGGYRLCVWVEVWK